MIHLKNSLKLTQKTNKLVKTSIFSFSSYLPYNFDGLNPGLDQQQSQKLMYFVQQMAGNDVKDGFAYAYSNVIQAIAQKDYEYLMGILEPNLYSQLSKSFQDFSTKEEVESNTAQSDKIIYYCGEEEVSPSNLVFGSMGLHYGVQFERSRNGNLQGQKQNMNMFEIANLYFYGIQGGGMFTKTPSRPIFRLDTYFSSSLKLYIKDKDGNLIEGNDNEDQKQIHKIRFETDPGEGSLSNGSLFQAIFKLQSKGQDANKEQIFQDLFLGQNYEWKIADIDNHLNGNEFDA